MAKKTFSAAPKPKTVSPDDMNRFIEQGAGKDKKPESKPREAEEKSDVARFPVYLPKELHRRFRVACVKNNRSMAEELRGFIERRTAELEAGQ